MQQHSFSIFLNGKSISEKKAKEQVPQKEVVLAFHGFGQHAGIFKSVSAQEEDVVFFCFDLLFHGKSKKAIFFADYQIINFTNELNQFLVKFSIQKFHLLSFSIGTRPCLAIAKHHANKILSLRLIAPDAIYENPLFHFATRTYVGNALFKFISRNEDFLKFAIFKGISLSNGRIKLLNLAFKVLEDHSITKIHYTWSTYSSFTFNVEQIIKHLQNNGAKVKVILSSKDHVISANKVTKRLENCGDIFEIITYKHEKIIAKLVKARFFEKERNKVFKFN